MGLNSHTERVPTGSPVRIPVLNERPDRSDVNA
jgi:hypothetical protein